MKTCETLTPERLNELQEATCIHVLHGGGMPRVEPEELVALVRAYRRWVVYVFERGEKA